MSLGDNFGQMLHKNQAGAGNKHLSVSNSNYNELAQLASYSQILKIINTLNNRGVSNPCLEIIQNHDKLLARFDHDDNFQLFNLGVAYSKASLLELLVITKERVKDAVAPSTSDSLLLIITFSKLNLFVNKSDRIFVTTKYIELVAKLDFPIFLVRIFFAVLSEQLGDTEGALSLCRLAARSNLSITDNNTNKIELIGSMGCAFGHQVANLNLTLRKQRIHNLTREAFSYSSSIDWSANSFVDELYRRVFTENKDLPFEYFLSNASFSSWEDAFVFQDTLLFTNLALGAATITDGVVRGIPDKLKGLISDSTFDATGSCFELSSIEQRPIVILYLRTHNYKSEPIGGITFYSYRNSDPNSYQNAVVELIKRGYSVVRVGAPGQFKLSIDSQFYWDYANSVHRSDYMDVYLFSVSKFCICGAGGASNLALIFNKPILWVDYPPCLTNHVFHPLSRVAYKEAYLNAKPLPNQAFLSAPYNGLFDGIALNHLGFYFRDLTPEQILHAVMIFADMNSSESGTNELANEAYSRLNKRGYPIIQNASIQLPQ
jgi:putative glycosyltransferase (TIGR04372 family)